MVSHVEHCIFLSSLPNSGVDKYGMEFSAGYDGPLQPSAGDVAKRC